MHQFKRVVASGLAVLITVQATGCMSWKTVPLPPPSAVAQHPGRKVQVILQDNRKFDADSARTDATTLMAYRGNTIDSLPLAEVKAVKVRGVSAGRTVGLVLGLLLAGAALAIGLAYMAPPCMHDGDGICY